MIIVSDTSPLSNLEQIGRLGLLRDLYGRVIIPPSVEAELRNAPKAHSGLDWSLLDVVRPMDLHGVAELAEDLDIGETEAIALALELKADLLLIDESTGREAARRLGLELIGLVGVLLEAKGRGLIESVRDEIGLLLANTSFRLSPSVRDEAIRRAGER